MGSAASSQSSSAQSAKRREDDEKNQRIETALKQEEDLSEFSVPEIARCRLTNPEVVPSTKTKNELFQAGRFNELDEAVRNKAPKLMELPIRELVNQLLEGTTDDLDKVRAIFYFIALIDLSQLNHSEDQIPPNSPLQYLMKIKAFKGNHAHLFCALCKVAGLPCDVIIGVNKSAAYKVGRPIDKATMVAQWNAVYVCGEWRLLDVFWSSSSVIGADDEEEWDVLDVDGRTVTGKMIAGHSHHRVAEGQVSPFFTFSLMPELPKASGSGQMMHRINEFFFLTDPEQMLATHLPRNDKWQLVDKSKMLTEKMFEEEVYRRERFYELGIMLPSEQLRKCRQQAKNGEVDLELRIEDDSPSVDFKYMLFMARSAEDLGTLEKFVIYERGDNSVKYRTSIPVKGVFKIDIFGRDSRKHKSLDLVCSYVIDCSSGAGSKEPLPDDPAIGWGPSGGYLKAFGMESVTHQNGVINTDDGIVDIKFKMDQPLELYSMMLSNKKTKEDLSQHITMKVVDGECHLHITLPESGVYACELFANEEGVTGDLQNICNYVIKCNKKVENKPLPYVPNGRVGLFTIAKDLGIELIDPEDPELSTMDGKTKIKVRVPEGANLYAAIYHPNQSPEAANKLAKLSKEGDVVTISLDQLLPGKSTCALYVSTDDQTQVSNVANLLVENKMEAKGKAGKKSELPPLEKIRVRNGIADLNVPNLNADNVAVTLVKNSAHLTLLPNQFTISQDGVLTKVKARIPGDGVYELQLLEKDENGETIAVRKRYQVIHEGGLQETTVLHQEQDEEEEEEIPIVETKPDAETEEEKKERELRQRLVAAIETGDLEQLQSVMKEFKQANVTDPQNIYELAEREVAIMHAREALTQAMENEDVKGLLNALNMANSVKHKGKLKNEITTAQRMYEKLERIEKLRHAVLKLDQRTIAEIKSFASPPEAISTVMRAVFLLLGNTKQELKDWKQILVVMGKTGKESLKRRVMEFRVKELKYELALEVKSILNQYSLSDARDVSAGAATFYSWATGMIAEAEAEHTK